MSTGTDFREPVGWPLLPVPDEHGELGYPDLARSVRENIQVLLATQPGEQLMRPAYGAGLEALLGEPNTIATRARIRELVQQSLARWEKRITVDAISVDPIGSTPHAGVPDGVRVEIAYRLIRTQRPGRIGMNLVLERSHAP